MPDKSSEDVFVPPKRNRPISILETEFARLDDPQEEPRFFIELGHFINQEGKVTFSWNAIVTKKTAADCHLLNLQQ